MHEKTSTGCRIFLARVANLSSFRTIYNEPLNKFLRFLSFRAFEIFFDCLVFQRFIYHAISELLRELVIQTIAGLGFLFQHTAILE